MCPRSGHSDYRGWPSQTRRNARVVARVGKPALGVPARAVPDTLGWLGVVIMMTIESACIPLPSEIIMPLSGHIWSITLVRHPGGRASSARSAVLSARPSPTGWARWAGGPIIEKYGKYVLIRHHHLDMADRWFARWGEADRLLQPPGAHRAHLYFLPGGRGANELPQVPASTLSSGSFPWSAGLAWAGWRSGTRARCARPCAPSISRLPS